MALALGGFGGGMSTTAGAQGTGGGVEAVEKPRETMSSQ